MPSQPLPTASAASARPGRWIVALLPLLVAGALWLAWGRTHEADLNFIIYRFADNLAAGRVPSSLNSEVPAPAVSAYRLVPLILAIFRWAGLASASLPLTAGILGVLATAMGAFFLARLTAPRHWAGLAYVIGVAAWPSLVPLIMVALALAAVEAARCRHWSLAGILLGLAILVDPLAVPLALLLLLLPIREDATPWRALWQYLIPAVLVPGVVFLMLWQATLIDSGSRLTSPLVPGTLPVALGLLALVAVLTRSRHNISLPVALLVAWSTAIVLIAELGGSLPPVSVLPGLIGLAVLVRGTPLALAAACIDLVLTVALAGNVPVSTSSVAIGTWLRANTGPDAVIASSDSGAGAFYAGRSLIDLSGREQANANIGTDRSFFMHYAPDVVVLRTGDPKPAWEHFATTYANVHQDGDQTVYQRVINYSALDNHGVDVNYSAVAGRADLRLVNVALGNTLHPGDFVRIRLDWDVAYLPKQEIQVKLTLLNAQGLPIVGIRDKLATDQWARRGLIPGRISTYHLLVLPGDAPAGETALYLGTSIQGAEFTDLSVARVNVVR